MIVHVHTYPTSGKLYVKYIIINANVSARLCWPSSGHTRWKYKKLQLLLKTSITWTLHKSSHMRYRINYIWPHMATICTYYNYAHDMSQYTDVAILKKTGTVYKWMHGALIRCLNRCLGHFFFNQYCWHLLRKPVRTDFFSCFVTNGKLQFKHTTAGNKKDIPFILQFCYPYILYIFSSCQMEHSSFHRWNGTEGNYRKVRSWLPTSRNITSTWTSTWNHSRSWREHAKVWYPPLKYYVVAICKCMHLYANRLQNQYIICYFISCLTLCFLLLLQVF